MNNIFIERNDEGAHFASDVLQIRFDSMQKYYVYFHQSIKKFLYHIDATYIF